MDGCSQDPLAFIGRLVATSPVGGDSHLNLDRSTAATIDATSPAAPAAALLPDHHKAADRRDLILERLSDDDQSSSGGWESSAGVGITACALKASDVPAGQIWTISNITGQIKSRSSSVTASSSVECLALLPSTHETGGLPGIRMQPCDASSAAQRWASSRNNESTASLSELSVTIAPIVAVNSSTTVNGTIVPLCLATNGTGLFVEGCLYDPPHCNATRCAKRISDSSRYRQLWYYSTTGQLMSTYTGSNADPHAMPSALDRENEEAAEEEEEEEVSSSTLQAVAPPPPRAPPVFDGPTAGLPKPDLTNRRCGDGHNGMKDQQSAMCKGSSTDGRLTVNLTEITRRCGADAHCAGFGQYGTGARSAAMYYRPVFEIMSVDTTKGGWQLWRKHGYKPPPGPPPPPPPPPPPSPSPPAPPPGPPGPPIPPSPPTPPPPLRNLPQCMATVPNLRPPLPPLPPPAAAQQVSQHQLQVWAAKMSQGRVAVVMANAYQHQQSGKPGWSAGPANVTAHWSDLWLGK